MIRWGWMRLAALAMGMATAAIAQGPPPRVQEELGGVARLIQSRRPVDDLLKAIKAGDTATVTRLLARHPALDPARPDAEQDSPLAAAADAGQMEVLRLLLAAGADVDAVSQQRTALQAAVAAGHLAAAKLLAEHGAQLDPPRPGEDGALHCVVHGWRERWDWMPAEVDLPTLDWVLANIKDVNQRGFGGATPLHHAARDAQTAVIERLLACGARVDAVDDLGQTPLDWRSASGRQDPGDAAARLLRAKGAKGGLWTVLGSRDLPGLTAWLAERGPAAWPAPLGGMVDYGPGPEPDRRSPPKPPDLLREAIRRGWLEGARLLLEQGAPMVRGDQGLVPLTGEAVRADEVEMVRLLLRYGAPTEPFLADETSPELARVLRTWKPLPTLFEPAARGDLPELTRRLAAGANIHLRDRFYLTALHHAAEQGRPEAVALLLDRKAPIDARDADWRTPLFAAAEAGHTAVVKLLLARGAQADLPDFHGDTPLAAAVRGGHAETAAVLR